MFWSLKDILIHFYCHMTRAPSDCRHGTFRVPVRNIFQRNIIWSMYFFGSDIFCKSNLPVLNVGFPQNCNIESENKWAKSLQLDKSQTSTNKNVKGEIDCSSCENLNVLLVYDVDGFLLHEIWVEFCLNTID